MKTLVVGAAIVDVIMNVDRLPKSGEDILCKWTKAVVGGCAYNVGSTLRNLGCEYDLCVPVGTGMYADTVEAALRENGCRVLIKDREQDNGYCLSLVEADGERTFITVTGIEAKFRKEWFDAIDMGQYDNIYVAGYQVCGGSGEVIAAWLRGQRDKTVYFAPGPVITDIDREVMEEILSVRPVLHLNEKEAFDVTGEETIEGCLRALYQRNQNLVIITLGAEGTVYFDGESVHKIPSRRAEAVDTSGAGDSHIGAVIGGFSRGYGIEESVNMANEIAAAIVGVQGPTMTKEEFQERTGGRYE